MVKISETNRVLVAVGKHGLPGALSRMPLWMTAIWSQRPVTACIALQSLKNHVFQLVITDLKLPGASGEEIIKSVREQSPVTPVIMTVENGHKKDGLKACCRGPMNTGSCR
jgi:DNA-binding NarL/FixJ family response regulator